MIQKLFEQIHKASKASEVFGDLIPSPPSAEVRGNNLCVNCRYPLSILHENLEDPSSVLRQETVTVLRIIVNSGLVITIQSVCFSAFIPYHDDYHRIYRYNILASDLPVEANQIDAAYIKVRAYSELVNTKLLKELCLG